MKPRLLAVGVFLLAVALFAAGCAGVANPEGWAPPVFEGDDILLFLDKEELSAVAYDGTSAVVLWTFPDENLTSEKDIKLRSVYSEPVVDDDTVYIGSYEGDIYAIGRSDGRLRWSTEGQVSVSGSIVSGPVLSQGRLVFGTTEGFLYSVDAADGRPTEGWPRDGLSLSNRGIWATPIVESGVVYVGTMDSKLRAIDLATGEEVWEQPFEAGAGAIAELASASDGTLFVATLGKEVFIVEKSTGLQVGESVTANGWIWTRPAIDAGIAYYGDFDGSLFALDITSQKTEWTEKTDGRVKSGPAVVGEWVIFADESPAVSFVNRETGQIRNRVPIVDAGKIRANVVGRDGVAYVVTTKGRLFKADPSNFSVVEVPIGGTS